MIQYQPININPEDLPDEAILTALRACEQLADRNRKRQPPHMRFGITSGEIKAGRALIAEAWYRGLISAPEPEATHEGH